MSTRRSTTRRRRSWRQRAVLTAGVVSVVACLGGASVAGYVLVAYNRIERYEDLDIDAAPPGDPENYLLVGSDSRAGGSAEEAAETGGQRSDTIMIVRIDPAEEQASVLSLHRDLWVSIAGTGEADKINSAYAMGTSEQGRQRLIDTIRENFGIPVHHYVEIDFQGFARLVDAVGGVPLYFEAAVRDRGSGLFQDRLGCVTLTGEQALPFVRSRHLDHMTPEGEWERDQTGDLGRVTRQQIFMREAVRQTLDEVRSNPLRLRELIGIGVDSVGIDEGLGLRDIQDLADRFRDFSEEELLTYALPVSEAGPPRYEVNVREREAEPILSVFRGGDPGEVSPGVVSVTVLNGSGQQGQASDVAAALQQVGFDVLGFDNVEPAGTTVPHTQVRHAPGDEALGQHVARHVTGGADLVVSPDLEPGSVELVTGVDFSSVHDQPTPLDQVPTSSGGDDGEDGGTTTSTTPPTTATPPPPPEPLGHAVGEVPPGADCD